MTPSEAIYAGTQALDALEAVGMGDTLGATTIRKQVDRLRTAGFVAAVPDSLTPEEWARRIVHGREAVDTTVELAIDFHIHSAVSAEQARLTTIIRELRERLWTHEGFEPRPQQGQEREYERLETVRLIGTRAEWDAETERMIARGAP